MDLQDLMNSQEEAQPEKVSPLKSLEQDLKFYSESIREVASEIISEGLSEQPIFVAHQHTVSLGELILDKDDLGTNWTIQASTLEEFIEKEIVTRARKAAFLKNYKDPDKFMCLFVIVPEGANFVFYPYK